MPITLVKFCASGLNETVPRLFLNDRQLISPSRALAFFASVNLPMMKSTEPALASRKPQQPTAHVEAQNLLDKARTRLVIEHTEETKAVVDPSTTKPPRLTARQRAKYSKLEPSCDILTAVAKKCWDNLSSSDQYLLQPERPWEEPFYKQLEEIRLIDARLSQIARCAHAQVDSQARH